MAHMGAAAPVPAADCQSVPIGAAPRARADAAATEARNRWVQCATADSWTLFGTLSVCASRTWVQRSPQQLSDVTWRPFFLPHTCVWTPLPPRRAAGGCNIQMRALRHFLAHCLCAHRPHRGGGPRSGPKLFKFAQNCSFTRECGRRCHRGARPVGAMCKSGQFDTFWQIIDVRIAHMSAAAPVVAANCRPVPSRHAAPARVNAAATGARGRWFQCASADSSTLFGTLSVCASRTWVRRPP